MTGRRREIYRKVMANVTVVPASATQATAGQTGCWLWLGPDSGNRRGGGYARMSLSGQTVAVHIVMYTHRHGYVPGKKQIDHTCRNRCCVNPDHLEMVTHRQNQKRRAKARHNQG